jgi:hypothetical protein
VLLALEGLAAADIQPSDLVIATFDPENMVAPVSTVEGPGVKVGEGTQLYPVVGFETGYVSNVFYTSQNPQAAGLLRLLAQVGFGSNNGQRLQPTSDSDENANEQTGTQYRVSLRASYDLMLTGDQAISGTGGLGLGATIHTVSNPTGPWTFGFDDNFMRLIRAANFETDANTNRDINTLGLNLLLHPNDRTLSGYLYFNNTIDLFERTEQQFANRTLNTVGIHPQWRWLPQTNLYIDVSQGLNTGIAGSRKVNSYPFTAIAGLQTLFSLKTTFAVRAGYTNGFYSAGPSYSSPVLGADIGYRYSPLGRVALTYDYVFADSINANYYGEHVVRLWLQQLVVPFVFMAQPEIHFRQYDGVCGIVMCAPGSNDTRDDAIFSVVAGVHYSFRSWIAATLDYRFTDVVSNFKYLAGTTPNVDPSFVRHELLLGMRVAM